MGVPVHVNVIWDPTVGYNTHTLWDPVATAAPPPGVPKPSVPVPALEIITTQMWTAGYFLGQNKFTTKTLHHGVPICIADHDIGTLIPDITFPVPNLWYIIQWPFSGRKMTFNSSTVKMEGQATSCSQLLPPLAMMTCGDPITLPLSFPLINMFVNNLTVGMTMGDFLMGLGQALFTMAIDAIFEFVPFGGKGAKEAAERAAREAAERTFGQNLARALAREALGKLGLTPKSAIKRAVNGLGGLATSTIEGNPTYKTGIGGGILPQGDVQIGGTPSSGSPSTEIFGVPVSGAGGNTPTNDPLNIVTDP